MEYNKNLFVTLEKISQTYRRLAAELETSADVERIVELNKQISRVVELHDYFLVYEGYLKVGSEALGIIKNERDEDLITLAREELEDVKTKIIELERQVQLLLLPEDDNIKKNVIIEMRPAAGGDEANIFVNDLFSAYKRYAENNRWKLTLLEINYDNIGLNYVSFSLSGKDVFTKMHFESGVHRVQRVPATESKGRVHTSTITVSVMVEEADLEIKINPQDLRIDTFRASGAGGQHVNRTESAVRITHLPTGIVAACQDGKSQISNRETAMRLLKAKLYNYENKKHLEKVGLIRKNQVGRGDRSEKIRTYNYPQNRVTDHRINLTINRLDSIMTGDFELLHNALNNDEEKNKLAQLED